MSDKTLLEQWRAIAYDQQADKNKLQKMWAEYFEIEKEIGKANYVQKNGAVGYSRSIPMQYDFDSVRKANELAKGKNTASYKYSKQLVEAMQEGAFEDDDPQKQREIVKIRSDLKTAVNNNFEAIYNFIRDELSDESFYKTDFPKDLREHFDDDILTHIMKTTKYKTYKQIKELLKKSKEAKEKADEEAKKEAEKSRIGKLTKKEAEFLRKKGRK